MSKKKHPEHVNHERWLVSYADFITLLFAFFVVLFASSQSDKKKQTQLAAAMQNAFNPMAVFESHSKTPAITTGAAASDALTPTPIQPPLPSADQLAAQAAATATEAFIGKMLAEKNPANSLPPGSITMRTTQEGLVISLHEAGFFASGSSEVRTSSMDLLTRLAAALPPGPLRVEGHTDNVPIHTAQFASNWELSTARATTIARLLLDHPNIHPAALSAAGYAEFHPIASNTTEAGRAQNRRVDIILLRAPTPSR
jgi:chemotaxis protein MotB